MFDAVGGGADAGIVGEAEAGCQCKVVIMLGLQGDYT